MEYQSTQSSKTYHFDACVFVVVEPIGDWHLAMCQSENGDTGGPPPLTAAVRRFGAAGACRWKCTANISIPGGTGLPCAVPRDKEIHKILKMTESIVVPWLFTPVFQHSTVVDNPLLFCSSLLFFLVGLAYCC